MKKLDNKSKRDEGENIMTRLTPNIDGDAGRGWRSNTIGEDETKLATMWRQNPNIDYEARR